MRRACAGRAATEDSLPDRPPLRETLPLAAGQPIVGYAATIAICGLAFAIRVGVQAGLPPGYPYLTFFPAVILSSFLFGRGPGILAAVLCGLLARYFFIAPIGSFALQGGVVLSIAFYVAIVTIDIALIHWMQQANRHLLDERERNAKLAERSELLFRELQHRVSNNLQVVAALLNLQKRGVGDAQARMALDDAARRLGLIGRIHRQLHDPAGGRLGMQSFLAQLAADLIDAGGKPGVACTVHADDAIAIEADAAIPLALIVAEAVSNALEHGFAGRDDGQLTIRLERVAADRIEISVTDDGRGVPAGFDVAASDSLGLRIATTLARQLGGTFTLSGDCGATARLVLPG